MQYEVKNRWTGEGQFTAEIECDEGASISVKLGLAVRWARSSGANLRGANLRGANLRDANLRGAYLRGADFDGAYLRGADFDGADLDGANLRGANLRDANLRGAYLRGADFDGADLDGADLDGANLRGANLRGANLRDANLRGAYLRGADLIDGGQRSDGYCIVGQIRDDGLWIHAGCRYFPIAEARAHWQKTRGGTALGDETFARLDMIEAVAKVRGLLDAKQEAA